MTVRLSVGSSIAVPAIASTTIGNAVRDRTVVWLALLFMAMVLLSAYLGWSATATIHQIYAKAAEAMRITGAVVPPDPVAEASPLALLRNMATYVSLIGALVAVVLGHQMIVEDRQSGIVPLVVSRPVSRLSYALGKMAALVALLAGLLLVALTTNVITLLLLPASRPTTEDWITLMAFYALSGLFLITFGWIAIACATVVRSETMALLLPVVAWLALTFVLPQITSNINPMAALNPVKAMVPPPGGWFFAVSGPLLAPASLTSIYRDLSAAILGFAPADTAALGGGAGLLALVVANLVFTATAAFCMMHLDPTRSDTDA